MDPEPATTYAPCAPERSSGRLLKLCYADLCWEGWIARSREVVPQARGCRLGLLDARRVGARRSRGLGQVLYQGAFRDGWSGWLSDDKGVCSATTSSERSWIEDRSTWRIIFASCNFRCVLRGADVPWSSELHDARDCVDSARS